MNSLAVFNQAKEQNQDTLEGLLGSDYFSRVQLCTSASDACKEGKVPINNYALFKGRNPEQVLGPNVEVVPVLFRATAMSTGDDLVITHDRNSSEFQRIVAESSVPDSGCMFGPEFLCWLPAVEGFATVFFGSKTARNVAPWMHEGMGTVMTLGSKLIQTKKYKYFGMDVNPSTLELASAPDKEALEEACKKFKEDQGVGAENTEVPKLTREL